MYDVYVKLDAQNRVVAVKGVGAGLPCDGWRLIDSGTGDRYQHAQNHYFDKSIVTTVEGFLCHTYMMDNEIRESTPMEIAAELAELQAARPPAPPTPIEELQSENRMQKAQLMAQGDRQDFIEDCIAEMAMQLYA